MTAPRLRPIGAVGGSQISVVVSSTTAPWTLDIDALVVPVDELGMGPLGQSLVRTFPGISLSGVDFSLAEPSAPRVIDVAPLASSSLRWLILTQQVGAISRADLFSPAVAISRTLQAILAAQAAGATRIATPLLSELSASADAPAAVSPIIEGVLGELDSAKFSSPLTLTFFDPQEYVANALSRAVNAELARLQAPSPNLSEPFG